MSEPGTEPRPHSAEQFGSQRDFWWNADFLDLLARRLGNHRATTLLDVGCGRCHWTAIATRWFPALTAVTGVDRDPRWVEGAPQALAERFGGTAQIPFAANFAANFVVGDAANLPFADGTFDVVTCQTVLMHLPDAAAGLGEMFRVTKPGGLVICAEPSNFRGFVDLDSAALALDLDAVVGRYRFWLACHRGRIALGRGDHDVGDRLAPLFRAAGGRDVHIVMNDKARPIASPYDSPEQRALLAFQDEWAALIAPDGSDLADTLDLAVAGGLARAEAESLIAHERRCDVFRRAQIAAGTYYAGGGADLFVAWATK